MIDGIQNLMDRFARMGQLMKEDGPLFNMERFEAWYEQLFTANGLLGLGVNLFLIVAVLLLVSGVVKEYREAKRLKVLQGTKKKRDQGRNVLLDVPLFRRLYHSLQHRARQKGEVEKAETHFYLIIGGLLLLTVGFIFLEQYILGLAVPFLLAKYLTDILESLEVDDIELIHQQLPSAIDNILKAASRYGDTASILYEASITLSHPLKAEFESMVRKMNSRETVEVLNEFKDKYNDIWVRSFVFIMVSMSDDAERQIALLNLKKLQTMLVDENNMKLTAVTNKKVSVNTNYVLSGIGAVLGLGAALFSEVARTFFFSTPLGLVCFIVGYILVFATIKINIGMSQTKNQ